MESLRENRALLYSLSGTASFIAILALGWIPELTEQFAIIDFPDEVQLTLLIVKNLYLRKGESVVIFSCLHFSSVPCSLASFVWT